MTTKSSTGTADYVADWRAWREGWEQWLSRPHGWLSAVSIDWLDATPRQYEGIPGLWWQDEQSLHIDPQGHEMSMAGEVFTIPKSLSMVGNDDELRLVVGDIEVGVTYREQYMIVKYDPRSPARHEFSGVPTYDPDPAWVLTGHFEPFATARSVTLDTVGWRTHDYQIPGLVRFQRDGQQYEFIVLSANGNLNTVFTDATSGVTTYPACRALNIDEPADDGTVTLDFNRAYNLPCAFSDYVPVCPAAPSGNHLPFAVEAGEKMPRNHAH